MMRRAFVVATALLLSGCSLAPRYVRPAAPVPPSWPAGDAYLRQQESALPAVSYRDIFLDERLRQLIELALANNRDLRVAAANVAAARARVRVTRADRFPQIDLSASADYRSGGSSSGSGARNSESYSIQGGISSFELDLFGRLANATRAEQDRALSTEAAGRTVRIGLISDLASAWAAYGADRDLLAIAERTAENARRSVDLTQKRLTGGIAPRTDLRQAEQVLATAEGDLAQQKTALAQDENLIRLLAGTSVDPALLPKGLGDIAASISVLPAGTDSAVLLRRPDVIEAEYLLRAANADIGVARAALFPRIQLTGLLGFASDALSSLLTSGTFSKSGGAGAAYTLFNAGAGRANIAVSKAERDAALAGYEQAIQIAFREVADALADQGTLADRIRAARSNSMAASDTARLTEARYRGGIDSFLANLDAQRSSYSAQRAETAVQLAVIENRITLYRVLGGDAAVAATAAAN